MSDSFNPQELLSKLRAKSNNSTAATAVSDSIPQRRNSQVESALGASKNQATKNIRAPISLSLTPAQVSSFVIFKKLT